MEIALLEHRCLLPGKTWSASHTLIRWLMTPLFKMAGTWLTFPDQSASHSAISASAAMARGNVLSSMAAQRRVCATG